LKRTALTRKTPLRAKVGLKQRGGLARKSAPRSRRHAPSAIRASARGEPCLVRAPVPGGCALPDTTVLAHLNGAGMGVKALDLHGAYACAKCHAWLDGGYALELYSRDQRDLYHLRGVMRTQAKLIEKGLLSLAPGKEAKQS
jgi:hypothetical protein